MTLDPGAVRGATIDGVGQDRPSKEPVMNPVMIVGRPLLVATLAAGVASAQHPSMPPGMTHEEHLARMQKDAEMKDRGAVAMGFDQDKTTHHFGLTADGGLIQVEVNDPTDVTNRGRIRMHLKTIARDFASGDFSRPFMTHNETPPGVETLQLLKSRITYRYRSTDRGGLVRIRTNDSDALNAVHDFLRYQIKEHAGWRLLEERTS
jgi:hypothetical protein